MKVVNCFTREVIAEVDAASWEVCDAWLSNALKLVRNPQPIWRRLEILEHLVHLMARERMDFAKLIATEGGKPLTDAIIEADRAKDGVALAIAHLRTDAGVEVPMGLTKATTGRVAFTTAEPIGPVVALSAFNHPLNLIVHQTVPAIATGCPVLVKPAEPVPLSALKFEELCREAGLEEPYFKVCPAELEIAKRLVSDPRVAFLSFIGSAKVGWNLRSNLAAGTRCALEHGGAAPVLVQQGADIPAVTQSLLKGGYYHSGQVCVSVQRVFADKQIVQELAESLAESADKLQVGDPLKDTTDCGPLIRPAEVDRVETWVNEAVADGAQVLCGGERISEVAYKPTLLLNPSHNSMVSREEVFGPVMCLYSCDDMLSAVDTANSLDVAFQAAVFGGTTRSSMTLAQKLDAAAVMIDDHTAFRSDWMPFAGRRHSGYGIGGIGPTMEDMISYKLIVLPGE